MKKPVKLQSGGLSHLLGADIEKDSEFMLANIQKAIGVTLTRLVRETGATTAEMVLELGISRRYLSYLMQGKRLPSLHLLCRLACYFVVSVEDFLWDD